MKIAIPLAEGKLTMHFGHCQSFALVDVDPQTKKIIRTEELAAPPHQPGLLPPWPKRISSVWWLIRRSITWGSSCWAWQPWPRQAERTMRSLP